MGALPFLCLARLVPGSSSGLSLRVVARHDWHQLEQRRA